MSETPSEKQSAALSVAPCSALSAATMPEKINARLFDLVRYMRSELHAAALISDDEYSWLCHGCALAKGDGSPSPRRLEDYDHMRRRLSALEKPNAASEPRLKAVGSDGLFDGPAKDSRK